MLDYLVQKPTGQQAKYPALILLHGYGSNEQDLFSFAPELDPDAYVFSLRAPHDMGMGSFAWYAIHFDADESKFSDIPQAVASRDLIVETIQQLCAEYPIDAADITLIGFSQGCILSYAVALSYPELIRRVVAMSGYFDPKMAVNSFADNPAIKQLSFFSSHGSSDQVVPVQWGQKAAQTIKDLEIPCVYKEYPVGHGVAPQNFFDLRDWLMKTK